MGRTSVGAAAACTALPPTGSYDVENREQEDPDDIDEVPVKTCALEESMFLRCYVAHHCSNQRGNQKENTDQHVAAVEPREHEETGAHYASCIKPEAFMMEMDPLERLIGEEQ